MLLGLEIGLKIGLTLVLVLALMLMLKGIAVIPPDTTAGII